MKTFLPAVVSSLTLVPLAAYLLKVAKRDVPELVHMAGAYFAFTFIAYSGFVHLAIDRYCQGATGAVRAIVLAFGVLSAEQTSILILVYMQITKLRVLESTGSLHTSWWSSGVLFILHFIGVDC